MINALIAFLMFGTVSVLLLISVNLGRLYFKHHLAVDPQHKLEVVGIAESAVFALLGLLVAFSFSGAYERFESRKIKMIEEANAVDTVYMRFDLLAPLAQSALRQHLGEYVDSRLAIYRDLPNYSASTKEWQHSLSIKQTLWDEALAACKVTADSNLTQLVVTALNDMFDIANYRYASMKVHPPLAMFLLLIILACLSAFLTGYSTDKNKTSHSVYTLAYVIITAFTLYIIFDLELPLLGLIRVTAFDQVLVDVKNNFKK